MGFYNFRQNNSGGSFDYDEKAGISVYVIVEADSSDEANSKAEELGIYFDGCETGSDCPCCGDRWHPVGTWAEDVDEIPSVYDHPVKNGIAETGDWTIAWMAPNPEGFIHYKNGKIEPFFVKTGSEDEDEKPAKKAKKKK